MDVIPQSNSPTVADQKTSLSQRLEHQEHTGCQENSVRLSRRMFLQTALAGGGIALLAGGEAARAATAAISARASHAAGPATIFGCFGVASLAEAKAVNAPAVRFIFSIYDLPYEVAHARAALAGRGSLPPTFAKLQALHKAGIKVVVTIGWGPWKPKRPLPMPTPNSARGQAWLKTTREFVQLMGDYLYYLTLDNEPITYHYPVDWAGKTLDEKPVLAWYNAVAREVHRVKPNLPIASPAFNTLEEVINYQKNPHSEKPWVRWAATRTRDMFAWADGHELISAVDVHPYVTSAAAMNAALGFANRHTHKPLLATEWGQNPVLTPWVGKPLGAHFAHRWKLPAGQTNAGYIKACIARPVSLPRWNDFVATAPLDRNFIAESYRAMCRHNVLMSAYFSYRQFPKSRPISQLTPLYATCTVKRRDGHFQPNAHFLQSYLATAARAARGEM